MPMLDKIKRDFARHQKKAVMLGILSVVMLGFIAKAYFDMSGARNAAAAEPTPATPEANPASTTELAAAAAATDERIRQSKELWKVLRESRGTMSAANAFTFDSNYFVPDPARRRPTEPVRVEPIESTPAVPVNTALNEQRARRTRILEQARKLIVSSTVVGAGISHPVAVINQRILSAGDTIDGFEIIAIKAREVDFKKEGETLTVRMADIARPADDSRGQ